ncbi:IS1477 transposase [Laribacter hongkongensis HLHK9]|uniref:IS1477 transposase n=1 Tax=Laribacter hongkongensis (strain HLHK9) TaxID=557598 RepID=C1DCS2_LARHH|nr:IS1477 transposase [Laribacter hongkongensis HLHK9]
MSGQYVTRMLDQIAQFRGYPLVVRTDNGPEFTSRVFMDWARRYGIQHILIPPGRPMQNGYVESFNARFCDKYLNALAEARQIIADWRDDYSQVRPHGSIGRIPPAVFAARYRQQQATEGSSSITTMRT